VLCRFKGFTVEPELIGWERRQTLQAAPSKDFGYGVINHFIPAQNLLPMCWLREWLGLHENLRTTC